MTSTFKARVAAETLSDGSIVFNVVMGDVQFANPATQAEAERICDRLNRAQHADRRSIVMGAEDKSCNNVDPTWRGKVEINEEVFDVISSAVFSGIVHYGILGKSRTDNICGWVPACLCNIAD